jgi:outer membrane protein
MKNILTLLALAVATAGVGAAQAKIGVVNVQRAIAGTAEIKKAIVDITTKYKPRQEEIAKLQADLQAIQQQIQSGKLSQSAEQQLRSEGQFKERQLQRKDQDFRDDFDRERQDIINSAAQRMQQIVQKLADERGLDVVVDSANTLFFKPGLELTDVAIADFDKAYPVK